MVARLGFVMLAGCALLTPAGANAGPLIRQLQIDTISVPFTFAGGESGVVFGSGELDYSETAMFDETVSVTAPKFLPKGRRLFGLLVTSITDHWFGEERVTLLADNESTRTGGYGPNVALTLSLAAGALPKATSADSGSLDGGGGHIVLDAADNDGEPDFSGSDSGSSWSWYGGSDATTALYLLPAADDFPGGAPFLSCDPCQQFYVSQGQLAQFIGRGEFTTSLTQHLGLSGGSAEIAHKLLVDPVQGELHVGFIYAVPEPSTVVLVGAGGLLLLSRLRGRPEPLVEARCG
jgi:hypothetical protein